MNTINKKLNLDESFDESDEDKNCVINGFLIV